MRPLSLIVGRELNAYLRSISGYVTAALLLLATGLMFYAQGLGGGPKLSTEVLQAFIKIASGTTMIAGVLLSVRTLAEERRDETLVLLYTAPISDWHIVVGKWLSSFLFLCVVLLLSLYIPALVVVNGDLGAGHLVAGYVGLLLLGAASTALGTLASSLTRSQVVAGVLGGTLLMVLVIAWMLAPVLDPPFDTLFSYVAFHNKHFVPFMRGSIHTQAVVYYLSTTFFFLLIARHVIGARRWK